MVDPVHNTYRIYLAGQVWLISGAKPAADTPPATNDLRQNYEILYWLRVMQSLLEVTTASQKTRTPGYCWIIRRYLGIREQSACSCSMSMLQPVCFVWERVHFDIKVPMACPQHTDCILCRRLLACICKATDRQRPCAGTGSSPLLH